MKNRGITLVALVVTIVVLMILAGISIGALTGENGIIGQAKEGKDATEISEEKEILNISAVQTIKESTYGDIVTDIFREKLKNNAGEGKTEVIDNDETLIAKFIEKNRYYEIDKDGNVDGPKEVINDDNAGDLSKDGKADGSEEKPFEINCIEDLVTFSIMTNGGDVALGIEANYFGGKNVVLKRTLDFKSIFSYNDYTTKFYGDLNTDGIVEDIKTELTKTDEGCIGFSAIGNDNNGMKSFGGVFDGKNNSICNLYQNTPTKRLGLFGYIIGGTQEKPIEIKNLTLTGKILNSNGTASGCLIGKTYSSSTYLNIDNIKNYINITSTNGRVGGAIGEVTSTNCKINRFFNYGEIINMSTNDCAAGGVIGYTVGGIHKITNCANYGKIQAKDTHVYYGAGGIIGGGFNPAIEIYNTCNYGEIIGNLRAGGIVGAYNQDSGEMFNLINSFNGGNILSTSNWTTGGLVGATRNVTPDASTILNSYYSSNCTKGVGNWEIEAGTQYTEEQLKSETFVNALNGYIDSNTDGIDTSNWVKWKYNSNGYPTFE